MDLNLMIKWNLTDLKTVKQRNIKVMSTFACGGGSSMGYKLAGCEIVAANDIDPEMAEHYKLNLNPKYYFLNPISDLLSMDLPEDLYDLDILDGSPPCSTFSMAGSREKAWGVEKHFREGQAKQVLSDLFFDYLDLVNKLQPKVAIAENVKGMIIGKAKGYTKLIMQKFKDIGYTPQLFLINAADCGVPQKRERVFFCAIRNDIFTEKLKINPSCKWVSAEDATKDLRKPSGSELKSLEPTKEAIRYWQYTEPGKSFATAKKKVGEKGNGFCRVRLAKNQPSCTLTSTHTDFYHWGECRQLSLAEWKRLGSFPDDYVVKTDKIGKYMIGMSVPPLMVKVIADAVCDQWLSN